MRPNSSALWLPDVGIISVVTIAIELSGPQEALLRQRAQALGLAPEELAKVAVTDLLEAADESFEDKLQHVLKKNEELYRRLG